MRFILKNLYKIIFLKRLIPSLLKIYLKIFKKNYIIIKHKKIFLNLNLFNPIDREIFLRDNYEEEQLDYLIKIIDEEKIQYFLDIGAHMGYYSIILSKRIIKVFAFEPIKKNFEQLKKNKHINKLDNLLIYNFALSNETKDIKMWVSDPRRTGGYSIYDADDEEIKKYDQSKITNTFTRAQKGDDIIDLKAKTILIKLDVERHELKTLEGLNNLLINNNVIIQVEIFEKRKKEVIKYLKSMKFSFLKSIEKDFYFKNF